MSRDTANGTGSDGGTWKLVLTAVATVVVLLTLNFTLFATRAEVAGIKEQVNTLQEDTRDLNREIRRLLERTPVR